MRTCSRCKVAQDDSNFTRGDKYCHKCRTAYSREHRKLRKEAKAIETVFRIGRHVWAFDIKTGRLHPACPQKITRVTQVRVHTKDVSFVKTRWRLVQAEGRQ